MIKVILISGKAGAGKNEVARRIASLTGQVQRDVPFAEKLKEAAALIWGLDFQRLATDYQYKARNRPKLIQLGKECRKIDPYTWADGAIRQIEAESRDVHAIARPIYTVSDFRFFNEGHRMLDFYAVQRKLEVKIIRVVASDDTRRARMGEAGWEAYCQQGVCDDESETQLDYLELPQFQYPTDMAPFIVDAKRITTLVNNDGDFVSLDQQIGAWWDTVTNPVVGWDQGTISEAFYRLARRIGPEVKLRMGGFPAEVTL